MAKKDSYESLEVKIDSREKDSVENRKKNSTRMKIVRDFFEDHGAMVSREKVNYCDYSIRGIFYRDTKSFDVDLGIQYKLLGGDFFPSINTLPEVLFRSHSEFQSVALVVEENGSYDIKLNDDLSDGLFQIYGMQAVTDKEGSGLYSSYKNFMQSMCECKVQARSIRSNEHFPMEIVSIIKYITKPVHEGLSIRPQNYTEELSNVFSKFPGVGNASVEKLLEYIPNLSVLCDQRVDELQDILGPLKGKQLYQFIHNNTRKDITANNWKAFYLKNEKVKSIGIKVKPKEKVFSNVSDVLRDHPCTVDELVNIFGQSSIKIFTDLMALKNEGKCFFNESTKLWEFGRSRVPYVLKADKEMDIGV